MKRLFQAKSSAGQGYCAPPTRAYRRPSAAVTRRDMFQENDEPTMSPAGLATAMPEIVRDRGQTFQSQSHSGSGSGSPLPSAARRRSSVSITSANASRSSGQRESKEAIAPPKEGFFNRRTSKTVLESPKNSITMPEKINLDELDGEQLERLYIIHKVKGKKSKKKKKSTVPKANLNMRISAQRDINNWNNRISNTRKPSSNDTGKSITDNTITAATNSLLDKGDKNAKLADMNSKLSFDSNTSGNTTNPNQSLVKNPTKQSQKALTQTTSTTVLSQTVPIPTSKARWSNARLNSISSAGKQMTLPSPRTRAATTERLGSFDRAKRMPTMFNILKKSKTKVALKEDSGLKAMLTSLENEDFIVMELDELEEEKFGREVAGLNLSFERLESSQIFREHVMQIADGEQTRIFQNRQRGRVTVANDDERAGGSGAKASRFQELFVDPSSDMPEREVNSENVNDDQQSYGGYMDDYVYRPQNERVNADEQLARAMRKTDSIHREKNNYESDDDLDDFEALPQEAPELRELPSRSEFMRKSKSRHDTDI